MEPEVLHQVHTSPPLVSVQSQINPVHILHPVALRSILILPDHLHLGLPNGLFPSCFSTETLYVFRFVTMHATCLAHLILLDMII
jgi:hypothetical protein